MLGSPTSKPFTCGSRGKATAALFSVHIRTVRELAGEECAISRTECERGGSAIKEEFSSRVTLFSGSLLSPCLSFGDLLASSISLDLDSGFICTYWWLLADLTLFTTWTHIVWLASVPQPILSSCAAPGLGMAWLFSERWLPSCGPCPSSTRHSQPIHTGCCCPCLQPDSDMWLLLLMVPAPPELCSISPKTTSLPQP